MTEGPLFLYLLGYDMFLLILLLCISPFIMKSKRNYHEGGKFLKQTGKQFLVRNVFLQLKGYMDQTILPSKTTLILHRLLRSRHIFVPSCLDRMDYWIYSASSLGGSVCLYWIDGHSINCSNFCIHTQNLSHVDRYYGKLILFNPWQGWRHFRR